jgi:hypothetical protein
MSPSRRWACRPYVVENSAEKSPSFYAIGPSVARAHFLRVACQLLCDPTASFVIVALVSHAILKQHTPVLAHPAERDLSSEPPN